MATTTIIIIIIIKHVNIAIFYEIERPVYNNNGALFELDVGLLSCVYFSKNIFSHQNGCGIGRVPPLRQSCSQRPHSF